jgi:hypothetical protein
MRREHDELTGPAVLASAAGGSMTQTLDIAPVVPKETKARRQGSIHLLKHLWEMTVVMMLGMAVLGGVSQAALTAVGLDYDSVQLEWPAVTGLLMAFNMTLPMVLWMRHRRHSWPYAMEMAVAMFIPVLALTPPLWLGLISGDALSGIQHMAMIPSMLMVMLRRRKELAR